MATLSTFGTSGRRREKSNIVQKEIENMTGIYELLLRAPDGREQRTLAWLPNDQCKSDYFNKARKRGLTIEIINE